MATECATGLMFGGLKYDRAPDSLKAHPSVYVIRDAGVASHDIFAVYEIDEEMAELSLGRSDNAAKQAFLEFAQGQSVIDTGVDFTRWGIQTALWAGMHNACERNTNRMGDPIRLVFLCGLDERTTHVCLRPEPPSSSILNFSRARFSMRDT